MREIKFRVWDKRNKQTFHNIFLQEGEDVNESFQDKKFVFMQYTGLKDKNGTEIYDGDHLTNKSDGPLTVYWDDKFACWAAKDTEDGTDYGLLGNCEPEKYEVIGNIYENKELLK